MKERIPTLPEHQERTRGEVVVIVLGYILLFWGFVPGLLWAFAKGLQELAPLTWVPFWPMRWVGWFLLVIGGGVLSGSIAQLWFRGRGLPISHLPPTEFVARGLYRWWRHPIYVGFTLTFASGMILFAIPWGLLGSVPLLSMGWWAYTRFYEEPVLVRRFGASYEVYRERTPLWWPRPWLDGGRRLLRSASRGMERLCVPRSETASSTLSLQQRGRFFLLFAGVYALWGWGYMAIGQWTLQAKPFRLRLPLDAWIPFVAEGEFLYALCYVLPFAPLVLLHDRLQLKRLLLAAVVLDLVAFVSFVLLPVHMLRPVLSGDSLALRWLAMEYAVDPPSNCFPSLHAATAWLLFLGSRGRGFVVEVGLFACALGVGLGALLVKQHYVLDIVAGKLLATVVFVWVTKALMQENERS